VLRTIYDTRRIEHIRINREDALIAAYSQGYPNPMKERFRSDDAESMQI
jgi:hypothetical protein